MNLVTQLPQWQALIAHQATLANQHLRDLLHQNPKRFEKFSLEAAGLLLDYSKNHIDETTINLLCDLAIAQQLPESIAAMFNGEIINQSELNPALHTALRNPTATPTLVNGIDIMPSIQQTLTQMNELSEQIRNQSKITDIVNIGIGGSDLGPKLVIEALTPYVIPSLRFHFINNIDSTCIHQTLKNLIPDKTLFIIASKSFTSVETLTNAESALSWFKQTSNNNPADHFIAITNNTKLAKTFGIKTEHTFTMEPWVGGRYSLWSAIGLPIMLAIGSKLFKQLLMGAHEMDQHFRSAPLSQNMPVILGLLNVWYNNFFGTRARAILPYAESLQKLPAYLQQAEMESTGKQVTQDGKSLNYATGQIVFGDVGTNGQHSFFQLLHQGTQLIPVDFIVPMRSHYPLANHHPILVANAFSQSKALAEGKMYNELLAENVPPTLVPHKVSTGNRPSNTILIQQITPQSLGALLALYEHKIYVQSVIWQINAFDQWGVELGKQLASMLLPNLLDDKNHFAVDSSTSGLIKFYRANQ